MIGAKIFEKLSCSLARRSPSAFINSSLSCLSAQAERKGGSNAADFSSKYLAAAVASTLFSPDGPKGSIEMSARASN